MTDSNEATAWNGVMGGGNCQPSDGETGRVAALAGVAGAAVGVCIGGAAAIIGVRNGRKEVEAITGKHK